MGTLTLLDTEKRKLYIRHPPEWRKGGKPIVVPPFYKELVI